MNSLAIGCDHGGFELKRQILEWLKDRGYSVTDFGAHSTEIVRYPHFAETLCRFVLNDPTARGILICSTGIGMSIAANRFPGIRASLCTSTYMAKMTRAHNDSNILVLGGKITGPFEALDILETWLATPFEGGRHAISLSLIRELESTLGLDSKGSPHPHESRNSGH
jgi:ribose 5-phosphate isomerase B